MHPQVSILIPVYNAELYIAAALDSALAQSCSNIEIIALDDGSTDSSPNVLRRYQDRIKVIYQENRGGCAARNRLMRESSGKWIQFLDSDDVIDPNKVADQLRYAARFQVDVVLDTMRLFYNMPQEEDGAYLRPLGDDWWLNLIQVRIPFTTAALWRREAIEAVGGWDEALPSNQEYDLYYRLLRSGRRFAHQDLAMTRYRMPSKQHPPKRDVQGTITQRLRLLDNIESHLLAKAEVTGERGRAIAGQRLQLARQLWAVDRPKALREAKRLSRRDIAHLVSNPTLPRRYLMTAASLGFANAERLAELLRNR